MLVSDVFVNGKIVDDFNILDENYENYTLTVSATQQLHRIIIGQKRPITVSKETHYSVKRDPLQCYPTTS